MRFAAAAAKSALALATPGPTGAGSSGAHGAGATTSSSTPSTSRLSPSPSVSSVRSAMDGPTMQDLGRSDSLERFGSIGGGGALDLGDLGSLMQGGSPEAREVLAQQPFLEAFKQAADHCNGFFVQESDRLAGECAEALRQLQEAERALAALGKHKGASAANLRAGEVWAEIKVRIWVGLGLMGLIMAAGRIVRPLSRPNQRSHPHPHPNMHTRPGGVQAPAPGGEGAPVLQPHELRLGHPPRQALPEGRRPLLARGRGHVALRKWWRPP